MKIKIDHLHTVGSLKKKGNELIVNGISKEKLILTVFNEELKGKKVNLIDNSRKKEEQIVKKEMNIKLLEDYFNDSQRKTHYDEIEVINPTNLESIKALAIEGTVICVKDASKYEEKIIEEIIKDNISYFKDLKDYQKAFDLLKEKIKSGAIIKEDEGVEGRLYLIIENKKTTGSIYIKDGKITFLDSPASIYIKHHTEEIKEHLDELNKNLELQGEKPLQLE